MSDHSSRRPGLQDGLSVKIKNEIVLVYIELIYCKAVFYQTTHRKPGARKYYLITGVLQDGCNNRFHYKMSLTFIF